MRIFYALTFKPQVKASINLYKEIVANHALKGRFIAKENIHLTLEFIGDVSPNDLSAYEAVLDELETTKLHLDCRHLGTFPRKNRHIVWLGIERHKDLIEMQESLRKLLKTYDLIYEKRKYHPHITLGRQVLLDMSIQDFVIPPLLIEVDTIALMVSHRVHDQLIYEPIYARKL